MITQHTFNYGHHSVTLETNLIAKQATSATYIKMGDTALLATLVAKPRKESAGFLPLTVIYQERSYAFGKIPGGYLKREGRPSERETLISRLIDRCIRPLFLKQFEDEVQIIVTLLSSDEKIQPDIPAVLAVSATLALAKLPIIGIPAAARVGYHDGQYHLNPDNTHESLNLLDLVTAGTKEATVMVESACKELSEEIVLNSIRFAQQHINEVIGHIEAFVNQADSNGYIWQPTVSEDEELEEKIKQLASPHLEKLYQPELNLNSSHQSEQISTLKEQIFEALGFNDQHPQFWQANQYFNQLHKYIIRQHLIEHRKRLDGRQFDEVRSIESKVAFLSHAHGSALFTRGNTQAIVVATLGTEKEAQLVEEHGQLIRETFLLHYNFPPYCVGETGFLFGPKRREIGHGHLAKRALEAVLPAKNTFPYTIRLVADITEADGSSSMATICGGSLALMDAGIPITTPVAGIAMGLIKENEQTVILSDINETEDHLGDMDFKVAGTEQGITALQMDIKIDGVTDSILEQAMEQARLGRLHILSRIQTTLSTPRAALSPHAPQIIHFSIAKDQIRDLIGKGGETIRTLCEETGANISVDDNGNVQISAKNQESAENARQLIEAITQAITVGDILEGSVKKMFDFGVFVNLKPGKDGLVHISEIAQDEIKSVTGEFVEGEIVKVKVLEIDKQGRIRLTMKDVEELPESL
ncbi:polyribonucleotide nucleotidyltransferase [Legionella pneumophila]|uniref:polyribonucleotide nucleotidyltransferase n=1 Tax=Legionella pneumophila TaxID=446 RepID=UPI00086321C1|nr:polyribonucleotide nucleotidyltransferase [Legionella pneumophila]AOU64470.1 polyribonucleotide nucleotidyltransferase [Legionella pneumophila]